MKVNPLIVSLVFFITSFLSAIATAEKAGFAVALPSPPGGAPRGPVELSPEQIHWQWACYVRIASTALKENARCVRFSQEFSCKSVPGCQWHSGKRACWGIGRSQCHEVLRSTCHEIIETSLIPSGDWALKRYDCDPSWLGRIIRSADSR